MVVSGQLHAPATLCSGKEPRYILKRKLGGPRNQYSIFKKRKKSLAPSRNQIPDRPLHTSNT